MNISSTTPVKLSGFSLNTNPATRTPGPSAIAQSISDAASAAAAKRKELATQRLEGLQERLKVMMMFAALGAKGNAKAAAQIAKEITSAVKNYAAVSDPNDVASTGGLSFNEADEKFLGMAKRLSYQVKIIITAEAAKTRYKEKHQKEINQMDEAINHAEKTLGHSRQTHSIYGFDGSEISLPSPQFSALA